MDGKSLADLEGIAAYYRHMAPDIEQPMLLRIFMAAESLASFPWKGHSVESQRFRIQAVVNTEYVIHYRVRGEVVQLLRIRHGARTPLT